MPITTRWYDQQQSAIIQEFETNWEWKELGQSLQAVKELTTHVHKQLVLFIDMSQTGNLPKGNAVMEGQQIFKDVPKNISHVIFVVPSKKIKTFAGLVFEMVPSWRNSVQYAKTLEEGQRLVAEAIEKNRVGN